MSFIALQKTKHSDFCLQAFDSGKGINIAHNDWFLAKQFIEQSYDDEIARTASYNLKQFIAFLKSYKLKILSFHFGYDKQQEKYVYGYTVRSKLHNNPDFQVNGFFEEDTIFVMFPQMFASYLVNVLKELPQEQLKDVADGN